MLLDLRAECRQPVAGGARPVSRIDERTLVIGLSAQAAPLITRTMKLARHRKAPTLAITTRRSPKSPGSPASGSNYSSTPVVPALAHGLLSLIQALAYGVYSRDAQQYDVRIKAFRSSDGGGAEPLVHHELCFARAGELRGGLDGPPAWEAVAMPAASAKQILAEHLAEGELKPAARSRCG